MNAIKKFQKVQQENFEKFSNLAHALEQIKRLSKEADRTKVDVATMLGEIAAKALNNI